MSHQMPSSSRSWSTFSLVTIRPLIGTNGRKPSTAYSEVLPPCSVPESATRSSREIIFSAETCCRRAISFAASRRSSLISMVVRGGCLVPRDATASNRHSMLYEIVMSSRAAVAALSNLGECGVGRAGSCKPARPLARMALLRRAASFLGGGKEWVVDSRLVRAAMSPSVSSRHRCAGCVHRRATP